MPGPWPLPLQSFSLFPSNSTVIQAHVSLLPSSSGSPPPSPTKASGLRALARIVSPCLALSLSVPVPWLVRRHSLLSGPRFRPNPFIHPGLTLGRLFNTPLVRSTSLLPFSPLLNRITTFSAQSRKISSQHPSRTPRTPSRPFPRAAPVLFNSPPRTFNIYGCHLRLNLGSRSACRPTNLERSIPRFRKLYRPTACFVAAILLPASVASIHKIQRQPYCIFTTIVNTDLTLG